MLPQLFPFAAVLAAAFAEPASQVEGLYSRNGVLVTEDDVDRLELYSQYARSASCNLDTEPGEPVTCEVNCDRVLKDEAIIDQTFHGLKTDVVAYVAVVESRGQIVVAFRPTVSDENWTTNCNYTTIPSDLVSGGTVHGGFQYAWSEMSEGVISSVERLQELHPSFSVVTVGHSLGGALAAVAAADLVSLGHEVDVYSYGAPRVGNEILSNFITEGANSVHRVTHNWDPIPVFPLAEGDEYGGQYRYRHISPEYWLTGSPEDEVKWPPEDVKVCEGALNMDCSSGIPWPDFAQHSFYFGPMNCKRFTGPKNGIYIPDRIRKGIINVFSGDVSTYSGLGDCFVPRA